MQWMEEKRIVGEVIVVDDGSSDATSEVLQKIRNQKSKINIITYPTNLGYGAAVRSGCDLAQGEWIAFMDSDGQFDVRDFNKLLPHCTSPLRHLVTIGRRRRRADPLMRKMNAKIFSLLSWIVLGVWVRDINCGMKIFHRSVWEKCRPEISTGALFNAEFFYKLKKEGIAWKQVDVQHFPRRFGTQTGANLKVIGRMVCELLQLKNK